jgi:DNA-binding winged helix-turn-helix (wHTH) protein
VTRGQTALEGELISFGPFRLFPAARAFEKDGVPFALGNRALDILMVLVERAGEVVSHRELIERVWRGLVVDPVNLRVHIAALRRALGDGYIANVTGQGYSFVAHCKRENTSDASMQIAEYPCGTARRRVVLSSALARMVGREEAVWHVLPSLHATTLAVQGELLICEGQAERGIRLLRSAIAMLKADRQILLLARAGSVLAERLAAAGHPNEVLIVIDGAIEDTIYLRTSRELLTSLQAG